MSEIKVNSIKGVSASTAAISIDNSSGSATANLTTVNSVTMPNGGSLSNRNLIINGSQIIDQRNDGSAVTVPAASQTYITDRFLIYENTDGVVSVQQSTTAPDGFTKSLKIDCTTADTSLAASQRLICEHRIEGHNIANLGFGSSAAKNITLSFYVRSNLTGTFGGVIKNSGESRVYIFSYTISSADTWERKSIQISGDTTGTWLTTNATGITINWGLALGSDWVGSAGSWGTSDKHGVTGQLNLLSSTDNEWLITGVQFEVGSVATDFEHRSYGQELALCQRYYQVIGKDGTNAAFAAGFTTPSDFYGYGALPAGAMRASPTIAVDGTTSHIGYTHTGVAAAASSISNQGSGNKSFAIRIQSTTTTTNLSGAYARVTNAATALTFSAEL